MTFLKSLVGCVEDAEASKATPAITSQKKSGQTRSEITQARYSVAFFEPATVADAAKRMNLSHVGCLNQVYRYERKNKIHRLEETIDVGRGGRALQFKWGPAPTEVPKLKYPK